MRRASWSLVVLLAMAVPAVAADPAPQPQAAPPAKPAAPATPTADADHTAQFRQRVEPLLTKFCADCHSGKMPEAGLPLDRFAAAGPSAVDRKGWVRVREMVRGHLMPPEGEAAPTGDERHAIVAWIEAELARGRPAGPVDPGRVTLRRLNRVEYDRTIRDLVGIDFQPAANFPSDEVGYGFDNIGDVLSLPPVLMERYLQAAEEIADRAIVVPSRDGPEEIRYQAEYLETDPPSREKLPRGTRVRWLASAGEIWVEHQFALPGEYVFRARAYGTQGGDEPVRMAFRLGGKQLSVVDVTATKEPRTYEATIRVPAGKQRLSVAFLNDYYDAKQKIDRNLAVDALAVYGPTSIDRAALPESHRRILFVVPDKSTSKQTAARQIAERFASRAWRRPATREEVDRLLELFRAADAEGLPFESSIKTVVTAVLCSPQFLFRVEQDRPSADATGAAPLSEWELATRLSYFLWSSMPDDALFDQCRRGTLRQNLAAEVRRMLADPKAEALAENFAGQWLQTRSLALVTPDPERFPQFTPELRADMRRETELFFLAVLREQRSALDFLDADYTFLNERLARHYGVDGVRGPEFRRVALSGPQRGGVLTQASVLTVTSNPTRTSPVKRGKWIMENILGTPPPPPPPGAGDLPDDSQGPLVGTLRQRMEQHRKNPTCASCHNRMDPLGFGFENYDAIGRWREQDGGERIDPAGVLPGGERFAAPWELKRILLEQREQFLGCLAEKLLTYALGRGLEPADDATIEQLVRRAAASDHRLDALVVGIVESRPFQWRRGAAAPSAAGAEE